MNDTIALEFTFPMVGTLNVPASMKGDKGDPGPPIVMGAWTPTLGSTGAYSGQVYTYQQGTYAILRDPVRGGGWCWAQAYLQLSARGTFAGQLTLSLPWKVANVPGIMGGMITYFSNPTPQADWPSTSWGWPILRFSGNKTVALLDTNPFPGCNPPAMTGEFINDHTQLSCNVHFPID